VRQGQAPHYSLSAQHSKARKYVGAAGKTEAISLHFIRPNVGTDIALNEGPLLIFQRLLGHSNSKTTLRYIRHAEEFAARTHQHNTLLI
jgi:integrase/recombinase XerD